MADLGLIGALPSGVKVAVVNPAATTTGTAQSYQFAIEGAPGKGDHTLALGVIGASAVPTTVTANLEVSFDGGVSWQIYASALALVASTVATAAVIKNVVSGLLYRVNATAVTIGSAVTYAVWGCAN